MAAERLPPLLPEAGGPRAGGDALTPLAAFTDVLGIVVGVLLSLCGLGLVLMGAIAMADRRWKGGAAGAAAGLLALAVGFWLVGVI